MRGAARRAALTAGRARGRPSPLPSLASPPPTTRSQQCVVATLLAALAAAACASAAAGYLPAEGGAPPDFVSFASVGRASRAQAEEATVARSGAVARPPVGRAAQTAPPSPLDTLAGTFVTRLQTMRPRDASATVPEGGFVAGVEGP
jgi:hypothetical protein